MNILVICQYYYPEPFRITDMCEALVCQGHAVTVVVGTPNYPMGEIYAGYENGQKAQEIRNGVKIHRLQTAPRKTGTLNRLRNYFSYARKSKKYVKTLGDEFDVVLVNQLSPVMMAQGGIAYQKKYGKKMVLYCLDLWPESLCVGGIKKGSPIYQLFDRISGKIYRSADEILVTSRSFLPHLSEKFGIAKEKIRYLPQYAEAQFLDLKEKPQSEEFHLLFAGNIGVAQSVETIVEAARILKEENICFDIVGDGIALDSVKEMAKDLPNVLFYGRKPLAEMPAYYEKADAMLVTLTDDDIVSLTLPGKVQTYMAAGKAIVGAIDGETALVLEDAQGGYYGPAKNAQVLAENILKLKNSGQAQTIGAKNKEYYLSHFSKEVFLDTLMTALQNG